MGVSTNVIEASLIALLDSMEYKLMKGPEPPPDDLMAEPEPTFTLLSSHRAMRYHLYRWAGRGNQLFERYEARYLYSSKCELHGTCIRLLTTRAPTRRGQQLLRMAESVRPTGAS